MNKKGEKMKSYTYVNDIGRTKRIDISINDPEKEKYHVVLWDVKTGEFCGSGYKTKEELIHYFNYYHIEATDF